MYIYKKIANFQKRGKIKTVKMINDLSAVVPKEDILSASDEHALVHWLDEASSADQVDGEPHAVSFNILLQIQCSKTNLETQQCQAGKK